MSWQDPRLWAALISVEGVGRVHFERIVQEIRQQDLSAEEFWRQGERLRIFAAKSELAEHFRTWRKKYSLTAYDEWLKSQEIQVVTRLQSVYPRLLAQVPDLPPVLFIKGPSITQETWGALPIAIVGTRHATAYGQLATEKIASEISKLGATIISGFMTGIDLIAHQAAVRADGSTICVLGFGFSHFYPAHLRPVFTEFLAQGHTFVTEFAPHTRPTKGTFPQRNRVVAGLARATIVVEAAEKSGSLITAHLALDYGREVYAVPGPFNSVYSQGTAWLLNQGAQLVTSGMQVVKDIDPLLSASILSTTFTTDGLSKTIYTQLQRQPRTETELEQLCQKPLNQILATLSMMEVAGWLKQTEGRWTLLAATC